MGICSVLAIVPFLCSAPAEEPAEPEEQAIESAPAPSVEMGTLIAPDGGVYEPEFAPTPSVRHVSDYEVLPPSGSGGEGTYTPQTAAAPEQEAGSFSEWVNQNWGDETDTAPEASGE